MPREKRFTLNDENRREWVMNDEGLYNWYRSSRLPIQEFVRENRDELTEIILRVVNRPPSRGY